MKATRKHEAAIAALDVATAAYAAAFRFIAESLEGAADSEGTRERLFAIERELNLVRRHLTGAK